MRASFPEQQRRSMSVVFRRIPPARPPAQCAEAEFKPDGGYIPRILFLTPQGEVMSEVVHAGGNPKYKYYYAEPRSIVTAMADAKAQVAARAARAAHSEL